MDLLNKVFALFTEEDKQTAQWNITDFHESELWVARQTIFFHDMGRQCSHIFDNDTFDEFARLLHANLKQMELEVDLEVGAPWGIEFDDKTGEVLEVEPHSQGATQGVQLGDFVA